MCISISQRMGLILAWEQSLLTEIHAAHLKPMQGKTDVTKGDVPISVVLESSSGNTSGASSASTQSSIVHTTSCNMHIVCAASRETVLHAPPIKFMGRVIRPVTANFVGKGASCNVICPAMVTISSAVSADGNRVQSRERGNNIIIAFAGQFEGEQAATDNVFQQAFAGHSFERWSNHNQSWHLHD